MKKKLTVLGYLYPLAPRRVVDGNLVLGTIDGMDGSPTIDTSTINWSDVLDDINYNKAVASKKLEITVKRESIIEDGMAWTFGSIIDIVQTRDKDKILLLGLNATANKLKLEGVVDLIIPFRAMSDKEYNITPDEAIELTLAAGAYVSDIYQQSWLLKSSVDEVVRDINVLSNIKAIRWPI